MPSTAILMKSKRPSSKMPSPRLSKNESPAPRKRSPRTSTKSREPARWVQAPATGAKRGNVASFPR